MSPQAKLEKLEPIRANTIILLSSDWSKLSNSANDSHRAPLKHRRAQYLQDKKPSNIKIKAHILYL